MRQLNVSGLDAFERAEFDSRGVDKVDAVISALGVPSLTIRTNTGQALSFKLTGSSEAYKALAEWAAETAADLAATGR